jgi:hypothetical protein
VSQRVRILAAAALVAFLALGAGFLLLGRGANSPAAAKDIKPLHPVKHHVRSQTKALREVAASEKKARKPVKRKIARPSVIDGMPASLALALRTNDVVVAALYAPRSSVDSLALEEARQGADVAGAGFVALNVSNEKVAAPLTSLLTSGATAADRVLDDPAVLIFQAPRTLFVRLSGYNDSETVAQAATNAGAVKVSVPAGSATWAAAANAICTKVATDALGLRLPTTASEALTWADQLTSVFARAVRSLHALKAPRGREAQVRQMLAYYDTAVASLRVLLADARAGKQPDVAGLVQKLTPLERKADAIARDLGATACGGSSSSFGT